MLTSFVSAWTTEGANDIGHQHLFAKPPPCQPLRLDTEGPNEIGCQHLFTSLPSPLSMLSKIITVTSPILSFPQITPEMFLLLQE